MIDFTGVKAITIPEGKVNKITANGVVLWEKVTSRIPSIYQEVEYVKATDNVGSYINLGFAFDTKAKIYLTQIVTTLSSSRLGYIFGAAENSGKLRCMLTSPCESNGGPTLYGSNGSTYITSIVNMVGNAVNEFEMIVEEGNLVLSNITNGKTMRNKNQAEYTMTNNLYLFAQNYNGNARFGYDRAIKAFKYYDKTNTLICDLVPCYRKSDGVIGMYDIARQSFLTNAGSGAFTKGADV